MRNSISLAKITSPALGKVVHRKRLYKLIDQYSDTPVLWIAAPAGYGKTTLINSYIQSRKTYSIWYKIDAGDRDIASFFYYMGLAVKKVTNTKSSLPLFTPEYQFGLSAFTRHYFRTLYSLLPDDFSIVLDNYQDAGLDSDVHRAMIDAAEELPQGGRLIFISRENPPGDFAKLIANDGLCKLDSMQLAFDRDESAGVAQLLGVKKRSGAEYIDRAYSCSNGWITGFKLLIEHKHNLDAPGLGAELNNKTITFNYFASEILNNVKPELKEFLLRTSIFPTLSAPLAKKITGKRNAKKILDELVYRQFFTVCHGNDKPIYEYHPLFRDFLVAQAGGFFDESEIADLYGAGGVLLAEAGEYEAAIELLISVEDWKSVLSIINKYANSLLEQGRNTKLIEWFEMLPVDKLDSEAYPNYWYGMALLPYENVVARERFILAYDIFKKNRDSKGLYLSWSGIADSFSFSHNNFTGAKSWLDEIGEVKAELPNVLNPEISVRLLFSRAMLMYWADPTNPELRELIGKIEILSKVAPNKTLKILCLTQLTFYYGQQGNSVKIRQLSAIVAKYLRDKSIPKHLTVFINTLLIACDYLTADFKMADEEIDRAYKEFNEAGLSLFSGFMLPHAIYHAELKGDAARVRMLVDKYGSGVSEDSDLDFAHYHLHAAVSAIMEDDFTRAMQHAQTATQLTQQACAPFQEHHCRAVQAYVYAKSGQYDLALEQLEKARIFFTDFSCHSGNAVVLFIHSWIALKTGEYGGHVKYLNDALNLLREKYIRSCFFWPHDVIRQSCAIAIDNGIQPDVAYEIINLYRYTPDNEQAVTDRWPYRIKIYTLGLFEIQMDGESMRLSDKHRQFVQALIALGGRDVHEESLSSALWPDADGDGAHQNFATTLHRIRKVLGSEVILLRQNRLSLNPDLCWVDVWALKRVFGEIEKSLISADPVPAELAQRAVSLYQGPFLGADDTQSWILPVREQLRIKYLRMLDKLGDRFCQINEYQQAMDCFQNGLEVDDLSESHYQGLLTCHILLGNRSDGLATYQRCFQRLADGAGIAPSKKTEELRYKLESM